MTSVDLQALDEGIYRSLEIRARHAQVVFESKE